MVRGLPSCSLANEDNLPGSSDMISYHVPQDEHPSTHVQQVI